MNPLLARLEKENNLTLSRLKGLFHELSKKTHPDLAGLPGENFIALKEYYDEAVALLRGMSGFSSRQRGGYSAAGHPLLDEAAAREAMLKCLYLYVVKGFAKQSRKLLSDIAGFAAVYDRELSETWKEYRKEFFDTSANWISSGAVYYTHNLFIAAARQLFYWYAGSKLLYRTGVLRNLECLEERCVKLPDPMPDILLRLAKWLRTEVDKPGPSVV